MNPLEPVQIGTTEIRVTGLGLGGAPLGGLFTPVGAENAVNTVRRGYELGIRFFDTAPLYGRGKSERFYGQALSEFDRDSFILSSKVGRVLDPNDSASGEDDIYVELPPYDVVFDFSRDGVLRSIEESLERLGLERLDIALIHDPDDHWEQAITEAYPTLAELRSQGVVGRNRRGNEPVGDARAFRKGGATSIASCSLAAIPCSTIRGWKSCYRCARRRVSA